MFPITDLSRADDIRMRRRRAFWLLAGTAVVGFSLLSGSPRHFQVHIDTGKAGSGSDRVRAVPDGQGPLALSATGSSLLVSLTCGNSITLMPQPDPNGRVSVSPDGGQSMHKVGLLADGHGQLILSGSCGQSGVAVRAPPSMPLFLVLNGGSDLHVGGFSGPIHLVQHGGGDTVIDSTGALDVQKTGDGDLSIGHLDGDLQLVATGGGDVSIALMQSARAGIRSSGSGDISIAAGHVGRLDATLHGSGDLSVLAEVGDASVQAPDSADITLPHVTGRRDQGASD